MTTRPSWRIKRLNLVDDKENEREREVGRPGIRKHETVRVTERQRDKTTETKIHKDTDRNKEAERKTETDRHTQGVQCIPV